MKIKIKKIISCFVITGVVLTAVKIGNDQALTVEATSIGEVQNQINKDKERLNNINDTISGLSDEQDLIEEKIADLNAEIINIMTSIGLLEDEIIVKEADIEDKEHDIAKAQEEYEAAQEREEEQYHAMVRRIQFMYENSNSSILTLFMESEDFSDILNKADYIESVYKYDKQMLDEYEATKNQVHDLWDRLEQDKEQLKQDKAQLEQDRQNMQIQKEEQDRLLAEKKKESANYDAEIQKYKQEAATAKKRIQQEEKQLKKLQEQQKKPVSNAANGNYTVSNFDVSVIDNAGGSDLGKKVAKYACQYIGYPYVAGGTSLTNGADCSGFTYRVYKDFGYNLPRTSYEQRNAGSGVSYDSAQPGDLICYEGHVAIYVGGGKIVHASTERTGIKISNANYRSILAVRRIV